MTVAVRGCVHPNVYPVAGEFQIKLQGLLVAISIGSSIFDHIFEHRHSTGIALGSRHKLDRVYTALKPLLEIFAFAGVTVTSLLPIFLYLI